MTPTSSAEGGVPRVPWLVAGIWAPIFLAIAFAQTRSWPVAFGVGVFVAAFIGFSNWYSSRQFLTSAPAHSLTLTDDALVVRDGPVASRLPYSAIRSVIVNRRAMGAASVVLVLASGAKERLPAYQRLPELIAELRNHATAARFVERRWVHI